MLKFLMKSIFMLNFISAHGFELGEIKIFDRGAIAHSQTCILAQRDNCLFPYELYCNGNLVAQLKRCSMSLSFKQAQRESDAALRTMSTFLESEGFKSDQSFKIYSSRASFEIKSFKKLLTTN